MELWEPMVDKITESTLKKIAKLLEPVDRISLDQLSGK